MRFGIAPIPGPDEATMIRLHGCARLRPLKLLSSRSHLGVALCLSLMLTRHLYAADWVQDETTNRIEIHGRFVSFDFGYSVAAPASGRAYIYDESGMSDHSIVFILGERRKISVYPYYDLADIHLRPCDKSEFSWAGSGPKKATPRVLAGRLACEMRLTDGAVVRHVIQAERVLKGDDIMYSLVLETNVQDEQADVISLHQVASNFRYERIS